MLASLWREIHLLTVPGCAAVPQGGVHSKKGGEAWTLSESTKDSAKVTAAQQALKGKLSKPMSEKLAQVRHSSNWSCFKLMGM